jgi:hypothetical protein
MMKRSDGRSWRAVFLVVTALAGVVNAGAAQRRPRITDVQITPPDAKIRVGDRNPFVATAYDATGNPVPTATFEWRSSNPAVASIDENGIALGVSAGLAIITATTGRGAAAKSAQAPVQVAAAAGQPAAQPAPVVPPVVPPVTPLVEAQHAVTVPPLVPPAAVVAGPSGTAALSRQPAGAGDPDALVVRPVNVVLVPGERRQLEYQFVRADGSNATKQPLVFTVSEGADRGVRVDSVGLIVAGRDAGRAVVRAAHPANPRFTRDVAVEVRADTIRFAQGQLVLAPGATDTLPVVVPAQGRTLDLNAGMFTFTSSDTTKVFVRPQAPIVVARAAGSATVTAENPHYRLTARVVVQRPVVSLSTDRPDSAVTLVVGQGVPLHVSAMASDSSRVAEAPLSWTWPDSNIARYDTAAKLLRGVRAGETRLAVAALGERDRPIARRWVVRVVPGGLGMSRARLGLGVGEVAALSAQVLDDHKQAIRPLDDAAWSSSADSIVRVSGGRLTGARLGRARVMARASWDSTAGADVFVVPELVVTAQRGGHWGLYGMMANDPSVMIPLTRDTLVETEAAWSPDLSRIVYVARPGNRARTSDVYLMDADGGASRRLTNDTAVVASPSLVPPNGDQVVFESDRGGGKPQIYVMGVDGSGRRALTSGPAANRSPRVSPDGHKIVFVSARAGNESIYEMDIDGGNVRRLTPGQRTDARPAYGPGGRSVFFLRDEGAGPGRLYRLALETATESPLTPQGAIVDFFTISAAGDKIAMSLSVRTPQGYQAARFGFVNAADAQFVPVPLAGGDKIAAAVFRPAAPR